jgi:hypothetical protein
MRALALRRPLLSLPLAAFACTVSGLSRAAENGFLYIKSEPSGAAVHLDDETDPCGTTPCLLRDVSPGGHTLRIALAGHEEARREVEAVPGEVVALEVRLKPVRRPEASAAAVKERRSAEAEKVLRGFMEEFDRLIERGEHAAARRLAAGAAGRPRYAEVAAGILAAARVARALEDRRVKILHAAEELIGQSVTLGARKGDIKGEVERVSPAGIELVQRITMRGREVGRSRVSVEWEELKPEELERLAGDWRPQGTDGAVARAYVALGGGDAAAARRALKGAVGQPLVPHLRGRVVRLGGSTGVARGVQPHAVGGPTEAVWNDPWARSERRRALAEREGLLLPTKASEEAVDRALRWLALHQSPSRRWEGELLVRGKSKEGDDTDAGVTALAVLAFLGAGCNEREGPYHEAVRGALAWLVTQQRPDGSIGKGFAGGLGYHHAISGLALAEAFAVSRAPATGRAAQKAVDYSVDVHQAPGGGWRYSPKQAGDTSVTAWFVHQLVAARDAGLRVRPRALEGAMRFIATCTKTVRGRGLVSYQPQRAATPTMTAAGLVCKLALGARRDDPLITGAAEYILETPPAWEGGEANFYCWYHATLAMHELGGEHWEAWAPALERALVRHQEEDGSWPPVGAWCAKGGRAFSTAMGALCLEVPYRMPPPDGGPPAGEEPAGRGDVF